MSELTDHGEEIETYGLQTQNPTLATMAAFTTTDDNVERQTDTPSLLPINDCRHLP
ncbi:hypothetical protein Skr01_23890 [Sphaerisporangium krabiense]|nr:hypothetical protein Skr01_23890 [Sphaerisporangium krabiense]